MFMEIKHVARYFMVMDASHLQSLKMIKSIIQRLNRIVKSCASIHLRDVVLKKAHDKEKITYPNEIVFSIVRAD
jgi:hypothetical protein